MGLGLRELAVLLCCASLALLALQHEGDLQVQPAWFQPLEHHADAGMQQRGASDLQLMSTFANGVAPLDNELAPPPLVTDIDGDGTNEVVLVTREPKLKIFKFKGQGSGVQSQNFHALYSHNRVDWNQLVLVVSTQKRVLSNREVGLLSSLAVTSGRQVVGLSSGYLRPYSPTRNRKQVIVVVNEGFGILVFNHKLRLMWTRAVEVDLSRKYLAEVAILVDPHPMRRANVVRTSSSPPGAHNDTGVVIVGGRLAMKASLHAHSLGVHRDAGTVRAGEAGPQPLEFPTDFAEALGGRILRPGRTKGSVTSEDLSGNEAEAPGLETLSEDPNHFDAANHFSYYAFEGLGGDSRWRHDSESFIEESASHEILRPQHEALHSGEMDWRVFRQSIMHAALPHAWEGGRAATSMQIAHVEKTRSGAQRQAKQQARGIKSNFFVRDSPLGLRPHSDSEHVANPNAIVVHLRDGIELLHLYSGRPLCRLTLREGQVHVDMDGDGVIDHVEAVGGIHRGASAPARSAEKEHHAREMPKCLAVVRSGVPPTRQLFNASICLQRWSDMIRFGGPLGASMLVRQAASLHDEPAHTAAEDAAIGSLGGLNAQGRPGRGGRSFSLEGGIGSTDGSVGSDGEGSVLSKASSMLRGRGGAAATAEKDDISAGVEVAHPLVIQEPRTHGKKTKHRRFHSFFFLNNGLVSSFNHDGSRTWHTQTKATWIHSSGGAASTRMTPALASFRPSLAAFPLRADTPADHVLVVGERGASLLSLGGHVRAEVTLAPDLAVAKATVADFNNDGINDFVLLTTKGYYGYAVSRRVGGQIFSILVLCVLLVLLAVFSFKLTRADAFTGRVRAGLAPQRSRATFTGALRTKSAKAQL